MSEAVVDLFSGDTKVIAAELGEQVVLELDPLLHPALLCSYVYLKQFKQYQPRYYYRDWMLDSGAYSAWNSGKEIDLGQYIAVCHQLRASDPTLSEIIALDVINDGKSPRKDTAEKSLANALKMKAAGLEVVPVFHYGEPMEILREYCAAFDKVGLSCRFGEEMVDSLKFYDACYHAQWPKKFHSFGWMADELVFRYPFHSFDSASWELGPQCFGNWKKFGWLGSRGQLDIRTQVKHYLKLEQQARVRWGKQMEELAAPASPTMRLAIPGGSEIYPLALNHSQLPSKVAPAVESSTSYTVTSVTKSTKKSSELVGQDEKWKNYWVNRGLKRDEKNLPQV